MGKSNSRGAGGQSIDSLATRLLAGDTEGESVFANALDEEISRLLLADPGAIEPLLERYAHIPFHEKPNQHRRRYWRALAAYKQDRLEQAIAGLDALLALPDVAPEIAGRALNTRANCYRLTGQLQRAVDGFQKSLLIWRKTGNTLRLGLAHLNLGIVAFQLQLHETAVANLEQAIEAFTDCSAEQWVAGAQNELGLVYRDQARWADAEAHLAAAVAHYEAVGAQDAASRVRINLGEIALYQGDIARARIEAEAALEGLQNDAYRVDTYLLLGLAQQIEGDSAAAQQAFEQARAIARRVGRRDILPEIHYRLAEALRLEGRLEQARLAYEAAATAVEETRDPLTEESLKIGLLGRWQQIYEGLILHLVEQGDAATALKWAERARARALADALPGHSNWQESVPAADIAAYFASGVREQDIPLWRALPDDPRLRRHLLTPARIIRFDIRASESDRALKVTATVCPLDPNSLATSSPRSGSRDHLLADGVRQRLSQALLKHDRPDGSRPSVVIPHGPIHLIPFIALLEEFDSADSASTVALQYAPSLALLQASDRSSSPAPALAVGYDAPTAGGRLRHSQREAAFVARLTGGEFWSGDMSGLAEAASGRRHLHFACHGEFDLVRPEESYLEVAPGQRLTAGEILAGWSLDADLVVLSACQSGVSRILRGDEPFGLVRAFLLAGARAVLVTQWLVDDAATFLLMQHFYRLMHQENQSPVLALSRAQAWLRNLDAGEAVELLGSEEARLESVEMELSRPYSHPRYWAPFQLISRIIAQV